jgi:hypothetical protein
MTEEHGLLSMAGAAQLWKEITRTAGVVALARWKK